MTAEDSLRAPAGGPAGEIAVRLGDELVAIVPLTGREITIGRSPSNALVLPEATVSSHHARLQSEGIDWLLTDTGSTNGTVVNGTALVRHQPVLLADGAEIAIGPYTLRYAAPQPPAEAVPAALENAPAAVEPLGSDGRRPTFPPPLLDSCAPSQYQQFLPSVFQDNDFLRQFLLIFESVWEPLEWRQDHVDMYFDPRTCPVALLPWLAARLDLAFPPGWPEGRMRMVLAEASTLLRWRGTRYGLERLIEAFTGLTPHVGERRDDPFVFDITLSVPAGATVDDAQVDALIRSHKPAHAGYVLEVLRERVH
jgi:phage tail-like protein